MVWHTTVPKARYTVKAADLLRQLRAEGQIVNEWLDLTHQEINCWRMFGIDVYWIMDELIIDTKGPIDEVRRHQAERARQKHT